MPTEHTLHYGQARLLNDRTKLEHVIVAGLNYGKTTFGPPWSFKRCTENLNSTDFLVVAPTHRLVKDRCLAAYESFLRSIGLTEGRRGEYRILRSPSELKMIFRWGPHPWGQNLHFMSGKNPEMIVAFNTAGAWLDEPALMSPEIPRKVIQRNRCEKAVYRQRLYTGTPEGTNWFYDRFGPSKCVRVDGTPYSESETKLVLHGRSHDNPYADPTWLAEIEREFSWDPAYYANYVLGEWTSLSRNRFYSKFNELTHVGDYPAIQAIPELILTWDNNVGRMAWVVLQPFRGTYLAVKDNEGRGENVDDCCEQFIAAFPPEIWGEHRLTVLGDSTLWHRDKVNSERPYEVIDQNLRPLYPKLRIEAPDSNPAILTRHRTTNRILSENRLLVDRNCKKLIESAKCTEFDGKGGVKKGSGDDVTHTMEAVDMALVVLEPSKLKREFRGIK